MTHELRVAAGVVVVALSLAFGIAGYASRTSAPMELVSEWVLTLDEPVTIGEPLALTGLFVCTPNAVAENPTVQFRAALVSVDPDNRWEAPRVVGPAREIAASCNTDGTPVSFSSSWPEAADPFAEPGGRVAWGISIDADGWVDATAVTNTALLVN